MLSSEIHREILEYLQRPWRKYCLNIYPKCIKLEHYAVSNEIDVIRAFLSNFQKHKLD